MHCYEPGKLLPKQKPSMFINLKLPSKQSIKKELCWAASGIRRSEAWGCRPAKHLQRIGRQEAPLGGGPIRQAHADGRAARRPRRRLRRDRRRRRRPARGRRRRRLLRPRRLRLALGPAGLRIINPRACTSNCPALRPPPPAAPRARARPCRVAGHKLRSHTLQNDFCGLAAACSKPDEPLPARSSVPESATQYLFNLVSWQSCAQTC